MGKSDYWKMTQYEQMCLDKRTLYTRTYLKKKNGSLSKEIRHMESSPYAYMLGDQKGVCKICKKVCTSGRALAIDHDHKTGLVRGLLCGKCNRGLGLFDDNVNLLLKAANYLKKHG